jgi:hypothetical protein
VFHFSQGRELPYCKYESERRVEERRGEERRGEERREERRGEERLYKTHRKSITTVSQPLQPQSTSVILTPAVI